MDVLKFSGCLFGGGIAGFLLGYPIGEAIADARHWSNFEGGAGMTIVFGIMPLCGFIGTVVGGLIGLKIITKKGSK